MLQIRLNKPFVEGGGGLKPFPEETVTVACPDHLVIADLPVAKGIGGATSTSLVKTVGRRSRRQLGERVHFCVRCDFPIAVYGRLSPCDHALCLDCARSDSICYLCEERIQKIQTIKMMEGIFICAAPHCLKSFLKRIEFESHIQENHADLLKSNTDKEMIESEAQSVEQSAASESTARGQARPVFSPDVNTQEDKVRRQQSWEQQSPRQIMQPRPPQMFGQVNSYPSDQSQGLPGVHNHFHQQSFDAQGAFPMPVNSNPVLTPSPYGYPSFPPEGVGPFYGAPHKMAQHDPAMNFSASYQQTWNTAPAGVPFESPMVGPGATDGSTNLSDSQARLAVYQADYERNSGVMSLNNSNNAMEAPQTGNLADPRDLAPQPMPLPVPMPSPTQPHSSHLQGNFYPYDASRDAQSFGWQHENRDNFPGAQN